MPMAAGRRVSHKRPWPSLNVLASNLLHAPAGQQRVGPRHLRPLLGRRLPLPFSLGCPDGSQHPLPNLHSSSGTGGLPPSTPRPHEEEKGRQQPSRSGSEVSMGLALVLNIQCLEISWVYF